MLIFRNGLGHLKCGSLLNAALGFNADADRFRTQFSFVVAENFRADETRESITL